MKLADHDEADQLTGGPSPLPVAMTATYAPSANVADIQESATIAVSARARALKAAGRPVIDLGAGEPDFPTPAYIRDAARRAIDAGATRYTLVEGILPLREVIADRVNARSRESLEVSAAQVVTAAVPPGATR